MPTIGFKDKFAPAILRGEKRQTVRRRDDIKPGHKLMLFTGLRTPQCKRLKIVECSDVTPVIITSIGTIRRGVKNLTAKECEAFARADGFANLAEMMTFFRAMHTMPFKGFVIEWAESKS